MEFREISQLPSLGTAREEVGMVADLAEGDEAHEHPHRSLQDWLRLSEYSGEKKQVINQKGLNQSILASRNGYAWFRIRIICGRLDPDLDPGGHKNDPEKKEKSEGIALFEMLDVLF